MTFENLKCFWKKNVLKVSHVHIKGKDKDGEIITKWCYFECKKHRTSVFSIDGGCPECFIKKHRRK